VRTILQKESRNNTISLPDALMKHYLQSDKIFCHISLIAMKEHDTLRHIFEALCKRVSHVDVFFESRNLSDEALYVPSGRYEQEPLSKALLFTPETIKLDLNGQYGYI
jgi:hypothetical protein